MSEKELHVSHQAQGSTSSNTSRYQTNVNVVITRNRKVSEKEEEKVTNDDHFIEVYMEVRENKKELKEVMIPKKPTEEKKKNEAKPEIRLPYPQRMKKKDLNDNSFEKFCEMFKKLDTNIPFFEALKQITMYQKFMNGIISKNRTILIYLTDLLEVLIYLGF